MPCAACRRNAPTGNVRLHQNIGMLIMRRHRQVSGNLGRRCIRHHGLKLTGLTLITGWWSAISLILNCVFVLNNTVVLLATIGMPGKYPAARTGPVPEPPAHAPLAACRQGIRRRLGAGEPVDQAAASHAPRTGA